jgi:disulfide bond formation protein DsbB
MEYVTRFICILFSAVGMGLAIRQVWIQHNPSAGASECGVSLQYMLQVLPLHEVMQKILVGSAECTVRSWEFLSLGMAAWAIVWFALFFLLFTILLPQRKQF